MRTTTKIEDIRYWLQSRMNSTNMFVFKKPIKVVDLNRNEHEFTYAARNSERGRIRLFDANNKPHELSHLSISSLFAAIVEYGKFENSLSNLETYAKVERELKEKLDGYSFAFFVTNTNPQLKYNKKTLAKWCKEGYVKNNLDSLDNYYNAVSFCVRLYYRKLKFQNGVENKSASDKYLYYKTLHSLKGNFKYNLIAYMWEDARGDNYSGADELYPVWDCNSTSFKHLKCIKEFTDCFILKHGGYDFETIHWLMSNGFELKPYSNDKFLVKFPMEELQKISK